MPDLLHELLEHRALANVHAALAREEAARKAHPRRKHTTSVPVPTLDWYREIEFDCGEDGEPEPWGEEWTG